VFFSFEGLTQSWNELQHSSHLISSLPFSDVRCYPILSLSPSGLVPASSCRCLRGVGQDLKKAYQMYDRGAAQLDEHSTALAANLLMRGAGTTPDYEAALRMFRQSEVKQTFGDD